MPRRGEYGDTTQHCAYCGKPESTYVWSNRLGRYCSHRCYAADNYLCNSAFLCCLIPFSYMMYIAILNLAASNANINSFFFDPASVVVIAIMVWSFTVICSYSVYIGYSTDRANSLDAIYRRLPTESTDYD